MDPASALNARVMNPSSFASHRTANIGSLHRNSLTNILFQLNIAALDKCGCQWRNLISRPATQMPIIPSLAIMHSHPQYNEFPHGRISHAGECFAARDKFAEPLPLSGLKQGRAAFSPAVRNSIQRGVKIRLDESVEN